MFCKINDSPPPPPPKKRKKFYLYIVIYMLLVLPISKYENVIYWNISMYY